MDISALKNPYYGNDISTNFCRNAPFQFVFQRCEFTMHGYHLVKKTVIFRYTKIFTITNSSDNCRAFYLYFITKHVIFLILKGFFGGTSCMYLQITMYNFIK